jgi:hypothetical protein
MSLVSFAIYVKMPSFQNGGITCVQQMSIHFSVEICRTTTKL